MNVDTTKLYKKLTSKEKARLHHKTFDVSECNKILSTVPRKNYSCLDAEFTDDLKFLNYISMWAEIDYWRTKARLSEHLHDVAMHEKHDLTFDTDNQISALYVSRLKAMEVALENNGLGHVLETSDVAVNADGLTMVYELEYNDEFIVKMTSRFTDFIEQVIEQ